MCQGITPQNIYSNLYPLVSCPGKFHGTIKMHKLSTNNVDDLPLRPILANIGTATYHTEKYLVKLLSPLGTSEYTIINTTDLSNSSVKKKFFLDMKWFHLM